MTNKSIMFFLGLCPIIPLAAHFAEGLLFIVEFWLLFTVSILNGILVNYFQIKKLFAVTPYFAIMAAAALYAQLCGCLFPVMSISFELYVYIFAFSYMLIITVDRYGNGKCTLELPIAYSLLLLAVSLLRELLVFGTVSLPAPSGLLSIELNLFESPLKFWGSSAGTLILLGLGLWLFRSVQKGEILPLKTDEPRRDQP